MIIFLLAGLMAEGLQASPGAQAEQPLITSEDYPPEALRNHWEGSVVADLTIGTDGRISACQIYRSSGHQVLDDATCKLVTARALFRVSRDEHGIPVERRIRTPTFTWKLR